MPRDGPMLHSSMHACYIQVCMHACMPPRTALPTSLMTITSDIIAACVRIFPTGYNFFVASAHVMA